ncbi:neprilysin-2-like [Microplitis mediator]|uniref:neprilysin-2-like n=1 Tax=Microplitis mediator TaxID=375433 RepID=UPI0025551C53|nr:neprilysin-2-like [Microplitis mediator]
MLVNIKEQFVSLINESTLINKKIKKQGLELLENIKIVIGYEEKYNNEIIKYYENLEIDTNNYLQTLLNLELFSRESNTNLDLDKIIARDHPIGFNLYTSSYYDNREVLFVPMWMLRESSFSVNFPMYVNYGIFGKEIAEGIAKTIVDIGGNLIGGINLNETNYEQTLELSVHQRIENCISNDEKNGLSNWFPPSKQIREHIAYKATYRAYQQWVTKYGIEPSLPELPFSNNQMFWIKLISGPYCYPPDQTLIVIDNKYSIRSFAQMRAVLSVPEFHKDFNCPVDNSFINKYGPSCTFFEA